jgi:hypothetical protein
LRTTADALRGEAGQARNRFGDADIGQLADVFRGDRFDNRGGLLLGLDRGFA